MAALVMIYSLNLMELHGGFQVSVKLIPVAFITSSFV
jgi:hypothetical protein